MPATRRQEPGGAAEPSVEALVKKVMNLRAPPPRALLQYTERWSEARLETLRSQGDVAADRCVAVLARRSGGNLHDIFDLLNAVKAARAEEPELERFLQEAWAVPEWMDFERAARGQRMIAVYAPLMGMGLFTGSLVGGGMFQKMATVTALSGQLGSGNSAVSDHGGGGGGGGGGLPTHGSVWRIRLRRRLLLRLRLRGSLINVNVACGIADHLCPSVSPRSAASRRRHT